MALSKSEKDFLIQEISRELNTRPDGAGKNLIAEKCPFCGKERKFGVYIGKETETRKTFMAHCFSCGSSTYTLEQLLESISRTDLIVTRTADPEARLENLLFPLEEEEPEIDDTLGIVELPDFYRRCFANPYLTARGFKYDDYDYFPVGTTGRLNRKFDFYVIFPILDSGDIVGYVSRHNLSKAEIDRHNALVRRKGGYRIMRFRNSTENEFVKLLYNYDAVIEDETDTVIIVEGIFDVVALTRKLDLYDNTRIAVVATFGKKISRTQIYKLQHKGVRTVVLGYDGDAVEAIKKTANELNTYFDVFIADIEDRDKDWEDLSYREIYHIFSECLKTPLQYKLTKLQE